MATMLQRPKVWFNQPILGGVQRSMRRGLVDEAGAGFSLWCESGDAVSHGGVVVAACRPDTVSRRRLVATALSAGAGSSSANLIFGGLRRSIRYRLVDTAALAAVHGRDRPTGSPPQCPRPSGVGHHAAPLYAG